MKSLQPTASNAPGKLSKDEQVPTCSSPLCVKDACCATRCLRPQSEGANTSPISRLCHPSAFHCLPPCHLQGDTTATAL
ncbi:hypothetical protein LX32DRAFT_645151 [Colletotrichum zoysiae]|uniref:Uncharacterized protein n=1 Tax=Colletotrichum zoysiae TaxID=1216348 RepID=A0AAD9H779_9PEZI|nr:hypothetical protein LX32DRAFT_645151 [Colletotrichum zoysiae]